MAARSQSGSADAIARRSAYAALCSMAYPAAGSGAFPAARLMGIRGALPILIGVIVLLAGCTSSRVPAATSERTTNGVEAADDAANDAVVEPILRRLVERWEGTPHVLGGMSESGMDCSAFVQRVFADAFQFDLPRTTEEQVEEGRRVNMSELRAGDLVFFQPPTKTNHVGIYLNDGEFAHVSTTAGVMVSDINLPYWLGSYWTSRRVLEDEHRMQDSDRPAPTDLVAEVPVTEDSVAEDPVTEESATSDRPRNPTLRIGW